MGVFVSCTNRANPAMGLLKTFCAFKHNKHYQAPFAVITAPFNKTKGSHYLAQLRIIISTDGCICLVLIPVSSVAQVSKQKPCLIQFRRIRTVFISNFKLTLRTLVFSLLDDVNFPELTIDKIH